MLEPTPRPCPTCNEPAARWLSLTSQMQGIDVFQCEACQRVWMVPPPEHAIPSTARSGRREGHHARRAQDIRMIT